MADKYRLIQGKNAAFDKMRLAEFEIRRKWVSSGEVPDDWWAQLLKHVEEYAQMVRRCKTQIR